MINFKRVIIENFMSIEYVDMELNYGINEITGLNLDSGKLNESNGSGKSSLLLAFVHGLYNRNPRLKYIDTLNNLVLNKSYKITIFLTVDNINYTIINDRNSNSIIVKKDDLIVTKRIKESLYFIENELLKLSYNEFLTITYITSFNIKDIFTSTDTNLIIRFFNLNLLEEYNKLLISEKRLLDKKLSNLKGKLSNLHINIDKEQLKEKIRETQNNLDELRLSFDNSKFSEKTNLEFKIKAMESKLNDSIKGICSCCNQALPEVKLSFNKSDITKLKNKLNYINKLINNYNNNKNELEYKLKELKAKLVLIRELELTNKDTANSIEKEIQSISFKLRTINKVIKFIKDGTIHKTYLLSFMGILNNELTNNYRTKFKVDATLKGSAIVYNIETDGYPKDINQLSSGEQTVVALLILRALLATFKVALGVESNLLILDEAINATGEYNRGVIEMILKDLNKVILLTQHHNEIKSITNSYTIIKENGLSRIVNGSNY